jgi:hypothetical protein
MFGIPIVLIGGYFIYQNNKGIFKKKTQKTPVKDKDGNVVPTTKITTTNNESEGAKIFKKNLEEAKKRMSTKEFDKLLNKTTDDTDSMLDRYLIIQNNVKLYEYPSLNSKVIDTLPKCTILPRFDDMYGEEEFGFRDWYRVKYKNKIGFVKQHMTNKRSDLNTKDLNNFIINNFNISSVHETYQKLAKCPPPYYNYQNTKV